MQKYQKTYFVGMGYDLMSISNDMFFPSELSGRRANDIHHIKSAEFNVKRQDYPLERLIMLTRDEHAMYGDKVKHRDFLCWVHYIRMEERGVNINIANFPPGTVDVDHAKLKYFFYQHCLQYQLIPSLTFENGLYRIEAGSISVCGETEKHCFIEALTVVA